MTGAEQNLLFVVISWYIITIPVALLAIEAQLAFEKGKKSLIGRLIEGLENSWNNI